MPGKEEGRRVNGKTGTGGSLRQVLLLLSCLSYPHPVWELTGQRGPVPALPTPSLLVGPLSLPLPGLAWDRAAWGVAGALQGSWGLAAVM